MITHYHSLSETNEIVTASMVHEAFLGTNIKSNTLLTVFEEFNTRQEKPFTHTGIHSIHWEMETDATTFARDLKELTKQKAPTRSGSIG